MQCLIAHEHFNCWPQVFIGHLGPTAIHTFNFVHCMVRPFSGSNFGTKNISRMRRVRFFFSEEALAAMKSPVPASEDASPSELRNWLKRKASEEGIPSMSPDWQVGISGSEFMNLTREELVNYVWDPSMTRQDMQILQLMYVNEVRFPVLDPKPRTVDADLGSKEERARFLQDNITGTGNY